MKISQQKKAGFTLIETVAVLALIALGVVFASMLFVTATGNYMTTKEAVEDGQKVQAAMNRLVKELTYARQGTVVVENTRSIQWTCDHPERAGEAGTVTWDGTSGSSLTLGGKALLDNVSSFAVSSTSDGITISLSSADSNGITHTTVIHPRYDN